MEAVQEWEEVNIKDLKKKKQHEKHTQWLYWTEYEFLLTLRSPYVIALVGIAH